eukprot:SM007115S21258  [mRNA]  locus=s7115:25:682:- [translate_table: standard]
MEEMDVTDRRFQPCRCGYQICLWCWHQLMELAAKDSAEGRCPACRAPYDRDKIVAAAPTFQESSDTHSAKKQLRTQKARVRQQPPPPPQQL